jgi:hypothetical protein
MTCNFLTGQIGTFQKEAEGAFVEAGDLVFMPQVAVQQLP